MGCIPYWKRIIDLHEPKNCKPSSSIYSDMTDYCLTHRPTHTHTQSTDINLLTSDWNHTDINLLTSDWHNPAHNLNNENGVKWNLKDINIAIYQVRWTAIYFQRLPHLEPSAGYMHFRCCLNVWSTDVEECNTNPSWRSVIQTQVALW